MRLLSHISFACDSRFVFFQRSADFPRVESVPTRSQVAGKFQELENKGLQSGFDSDLDWSAFEPEKDTDASVYDAYEADITADVVDAARYEMRLHMQNIAPESSSVLPSLVTARDRADARAFGIDLDGCDPNAWKRLDTAQRTGVAPRATTVRAAYAEHRGLGQSRTAFQSAPPTVSDYASSVNLPQSAQHSIVSPAPAEAGFKLSDFTPPHSAPDADVRAAAKGLNPSLTDRVASFGKSAFEGAKSVASKVTSAVSNTVSSVAGKAKDTAKGWFSKAKSWFSGPVEA